MRTLIQTVVTAIRSEWKSTKGQTLVEYALILAILSIIALGIFAFLGKRIIAVFSAITVILDTAQSSH